jgi:hypothetical protein
LIMTPLSARLAFTGFLAMAGAISVNALYLQEPPSRLPEVTGTVRAGNPGARDGSTSAPDAAPAQNPAQPRQPEPVRPPLSAPDRPSALPSADVPQEITPPRAEAQERIPTEVLVGAIQRELSDRGYDAGRRDGNVDVPTREAIMAFEFDAGLTLTGTPSEVLLKQILFGPYRTNQGAGDGSERVEREPRLVGEVQTRLAELGFSSAPATGRMSQATRDAVRAFEKNRELPISGQLGMRVMLEIVIVSGKPLPPRDDAG